METPMNVCSLWSVWSLPRVPRNISELLFQLLWWSCQISRRFFNDQILPYHIKTTPDGSTKAFEVSCLFGNGLIFFCPSCSGLIFLTSWHSNCRLACLIFFFPPRRFPHSRQAFWYLDLCENKLEGNAAWLSPWRH